MSPHLRAVRRAARLAGVLAATAAALSAKVRVPAIISDHMVVQAGLVAPIWGWAEAGEKVTVSLAGQTQTVVTGADGRWVVRLAALPPEPRPQTLAIKGDNEIVVRDVLIGEVWLASGQSNMNRVVRMALNPAEEIATAEFPALRMFIVPKTVAREPAENCAGAWVVCSPKTVERFSAVGYFFGRELHRTLNLPVGIVHSSLGGTDIAAWTSEEAQAADADLGAAMRRWAADEAGYDPAAAEARHRKQMAVWTHAAALAKAAGKTAPGKPRAPIAPRENPNRPGSLFNGMIAPLISYRFRGAIWYQGEHNCSSVAAAELYRRQLPLLIADWRQRAGNDFWFGWVQLPNYQNRGYWPLVREAMLESLRVEKTGMAVTIDIGDPEDLHPRNKQDVGRRLAFWALGAVYRQEVPAASGPIVQQWSRRGREVVVQFAHAETGLVARGGELRGFVIAGEDRVWRPADARIVGTTVVVSHPDLAQPAAVRYAFEGAPTISLFNGAGLPASPFRTDRWPMP